MAIRQTSTVPRLLPDYRATDPHQVGRKFARLADLLSHDFPVPRFYCLPGAIFDEMLNGLTHSTAGMAGPPGTGTGTATDQTVLRRAAWLRDEWATVEVPDPLAAELLAAFDALVGRDGLVAVRACSVATEDGGGEDSATDPFAGLSDSFLYVGRDQLPHRVRDCWASGFTDRAVRYRLARGLDPLAVSIAVGVQRMVPAARSFVGFSRNPLNGADECLIAAAYGVGEGIVQEKSDVDHFYVDRGSQTVRSRLVPKTTMMNPDPSRPTDGPVPLPVPDTLVDVPVLADGEARDIAALIHRVERRFGGPQDVEGVITSDGAVRLVQARPALVPAPAPAVVPSRDLPAPGATSVTWSNSNITESFPGVCGTLTYSLARELCEIGFTDFYRRMGVPADTLEHNRHELRRMIAHLRGHIYCRMDTWYHLHHTLLPRFDLLRGTWEPAMGLHDTAPPPVQRRLRRLVQGLRLTGHVMALLPRLPRHRARIRGFLRWWDQLFQGWLDAPSRPAAELVEEYQRLWGQTRRRWGVTHVNNYYLLLTLRLINTLLARWAPDAQQGVVTGMLCGGQENRTAAALRSAIALAEQIREIPALRAAVRDGDPRDVWADVIARRYGEPIADAALRHVRRYGDRGPQDLKLETVTVRAAPWTLLRMLRAYLDHPLDVAGNRQQESEVRAAAEEALRRHCPGPLRRAVLRILFAAMRKFTQDREDTRFCRSQLFGISREIILALGADLAASGVLERAEDVIDLSWDEVLGLYQGTFAGCEAQKLVRLRREQRTAWQRLPNLPIRFTTPAGTPLALALPLALAADVAATDPTSGRGDAAEPSAGPATLAGIGSSPGRVRAQARVVLDPSIDAEQCRGRILIARETDPGWLYLMICSRGMIVERGSLVSHTAITGRILAVPTVVAVAQATTRIHDGDWIEMDGATGQVTILDGPGGAG